MKSIKQEESSIAISGVQHETVGGVSLDYSFYSGDDNYSDGSVEDDLLDIVRHNDNYELVLREHNEWPYLYHLSLLRHNLLEWYDFNPGASLLEVGSGCGALTGLFCDKCHDVTAVEFSRKRSIINAVRNKSHGNLKIIVGDFNKIQLSKRFDFVTLIGVLEYSAIYMPSSDEPFRDMLVRAKSCLKSDGQLILAIENKYGLKYWAGHPEDHTGKLFDGITGYPTTIAARTFSKNALEDLLENVGFSKCEFYYPFPDYKLPTYVFSDEYLPSSIQFRLDSHPYDLDRHQLFSENLAAFALSQDKLWPFFANSFLVFATLKESHE